MDKSTSEIAKLTERISRDPKSKLFVPLAEEYKKSGDIEMAVHVLTEGLKNNPGYVTARSFLGRLLLEMGDMAAARREFEEVVKAVPDNLLAQKKLGDLHILLGNRTEALKYYKTARSLNPADAEIASLVSDLEAGIDVRPGIGKPAAAPAPEPAVPAGSRPAPQHKAAEPAKMEAPEESAGTRRPDDETERPKTGDEAVLSKPDVLAEETVSAATGLVPPAVAVPGEPEITGVEDASAPSDQIPAAATTPEGEAEVAEEVLFVEPLEEEFSPEGAPSPLQEEERGFLKEPESSPEAVAETAAPEETPVVWAEAETAVARTEDESGDFTTDTLAELYIGQGFYEKAIDIYERMLADHPDSRALQEKLDRVRSLAVSLEVQAAQPPAETEAAKAETDFTLEAPEHAPSASPKTEGEEITLDADLVEESETIRPDAAARGAEDLFAEPKEYRPPAETEETAGAGEEKFIDVFMNPPAEEFTGAKAESPAFEPKEYIPPDAELRMRAEEKEHPGPKHTREHRKEVIDRLENWLKAIKKEI